MTENQPLNTYWLIAGGFAIVVVLEFSTPPDYVFGYLYTGPILLVAFSRIKNSSATFQVTLVALVLTLLNIFIPGKEPFSWAAVANRSIAAISLVVTGWLSDRHHRHQEAIAASQSQLQYQQQLESMRQDFVSTLTHDLKTPLLGAIETLKSFQTGQFGTVTSTQRKVLAMMARSHQTTLQMLETLLDVYRNDTEGLKLHLEPVNLVVIAEEVIATLTDLATTRRVYVSLSYGRSDFRRFLWVNGDALQLQRVFANLLINGINHSPRGGKVEIVTNSDATNHTVEIIDDGQGITESELPHLFERFYQGNSDRQAKGSGLGLYLARQIIVAHGGTIWAENRPSGGALFGFQLPAVPPPPLDR